MEIWETGLKKKLTIRMSYRQYRLLEAMCKMENVSTSGMIRKLIEDKVDVLQMIDPQDLDDEAIFI